MKRKSPAIQGLRKKLLPLVKPPRLSVIQNLTQNHMEAKHFECNGVYHGEAGEAVCVFLKGRERQEIERKLEEGWESGIMSGCVLIRA